jgi:excisionase family DNA binding protein
MGEINERPYTVKSLAERWDCSRDVVYDMLTGGRLQGFKLGGMKSSWRIAAAEVQRFESGASTASTDSNSDSSTERPSSRGGRKGRGAASGSASTPNSKGELRLIAGPDAKGP